MKIPNRILKITILLGISIVLVIILAPKTKAQNLGRQTFSTAVSFVAGDATKTIVAAPGAAGTLFVTYLACTITTSAAQSVDFDNSSTVDLIRLSASPTANIVYAVGPMDTGISLGANNPLQYTPAAAGNAGNCVAEGYIVRTGA